MRLIQPFFCSWLIALSVTFGQLFVSPQEARGQATCSTPTNVSGFGVDGDVKANTPVGVSGDSWYYSSSYPGSGIGVIGTTAATATPAISSAQFAAILQSATSTQQRNRTYLQRMSVPALTVVNGNSLIDAFAARDNISPDSSAFTGSNKNGDNPTNWNVGTTSVPNKNDIIDVGGHLRRNILTGKLWMFAYLTKLSTGGDSYTDIEIYRNVPVLNLGTGKFTNTGPASTGGHTAFSFSSNGAIQNPGDIILCMNYGSGGGVASIRIWCNINNLDGNGNGYTWFNSRSGRAFNFTGDIMIGANTNGYGYAEIVSLSGAPCLMFSVLNAANTPAGDWGNLTGSNASYDTNIEPEQLVNIAFNFTDIGLDFATLAGPCYNVFGALLFKSRSSSSYSSELKDCSGPFTFGNFSEVQANAGPDKVISCNTSQVTLNGTSATAGAALSWSTPNGNIVSGANTANAVVNQPGIYILSAQSPTLGSCVATDTVLVTLNNTLPNADAGIDKTITCATSNVTLAGSSTTPGATYNWTAINGGNIVSGATTLNAVVSAAGCYIFTVTNPANGCSKSDTACVMLNTNAPTISGSSQTNVSCYSGCNGSAAVTISGGQAPYSYLWSNSTTSTSVTGLCSGTYTVTVTGSNGCTSTRTFTITQPSAALSASASSTQNVSCTGGSNGAVTVAASGATAPYSYQWNTGSTTSSLSGLSAGTYTVTVTDANGCTSVSSASVTQPASAINASISSTHNVSCFGGNSGSVDLTPSGGTIPYTYLWSNGTTTQDLTNIVAGTYTVTVTDANGCSAVQSATISQPSAALALSTSMNQPVSCNGGNNGSASASVSGGTTPYTYIWSNGASTASISSLTAGTYSVTVTDANGCIANSNVTVTQPSAALSSTITSSQAVNCFGGNSGSVNLSVAGGTAPYTYVWSNGATTQDISNLTAGTYSVTVTDARGCTSASTVTITQPSAALNAAASASQNVSCYGGNNGAVSLSVSGGTSPYSYVWNNGATSQNLSGLSSGTYTVTVTDANGCVKSTSITITQPAAALSSSISVSQNVSCFAGSNGSINLTVQNGTAPYTFLWSNGSTSQNLSGLSSGSYSVTITDANGCTNLKSATVTQPAAAVNSSLSVSQNVSCFGGNNGSLNLTVSGGTSPYTYLWSNGSTTQNISGVTSGSYTVSVSDANGCTASATASVSQPSAALSASVSSSQQVSCFGGNNGSVNLSVTGGTSPFSYNWSNGATTQNISGLFSGTYTVTVTDANGCTSVKSQTINQPSAALSTTANVTQQVSCFGGSNGSVNLVVNGGTSPYSFQWNSGQTSQNLSGLSSGSYSVTVTDANGCTAVRSVTITQPVAPLSANASQSQAVSCNGGTDGQIALTVNGGTAPYAFIWNNGATTQSINGLSAGTYTVTVTDANNCVSSSVAVITQPSNALAASATTTANISCFSGSNGSIDLTVSGGTVPYSFMWNTGATSEDLTGLPAGNYYVTITDANGCTTNSASTISQPAGSLAANLNVSQNVACYGGGNGSLDLTVTGGTTPYTYTWNTGATTEDLTGLPIGTYTVSITDANGCISSATGSITQPTAALNATVNAVQPVSCFAGNNGAIQLVVSGGTAPYSYNWSNGATSQSLNNLVSGTYTVSITDAHGCTFTQSATVSQPAAALNATISGSVDVACFGGDNGSINLTVTGGTAPYSFNWSNGSSTQNQSGLTQGTYSVNILDVNGCNTSASVDINEPVAPLNLSLTSSQSILCFGGNNGAINVSVTGGTAPYSYSWNNGANTPSVSGLTSGTYTLTVTDANGCLGNTSVTLTQPVSPLATSIASTADVLCFGGTNGSIDVTVTGGTAPYTYNWSNGAVTQNLSGIQAGTYIVTITDANGCSAGHTVVISEPSAQLSASGNVTANILCYGGNNGSVDLTVTGGTAPYTYLWNTGDVTEDLSSIPAGFYSVNITDMNGCTASLSLTVTEPAAELSSAISSSQNVNCFGGNNGAISLTVSGGTQPYTFIWSNGENTQDISNLSMGTYTVSVTDANGCTSSNSVTIAQPANPLSVTVGSTVDVSCFGGDNGIIDLNVTGGTAPYVFQWNNGETTEDLSNLTAGVYSVVITDNNGCTESSSVTIGEPGAALTPVITATTAVNCFAGEDGSIDLTVTGGTQPYSYSWNNGATTEDLVNLFAGTYVVDIVDANGCEATVSATITQPSAPLLGLATVTSNVYCNGGSNGSIDLTINGGTAPYSVLWSNGATTEDLANLSTGVYTATITDVNGCSTTVSAGIGQPAQQLNGSLTSQDVLCFNGNNGFVDLTTTGGTAPYAYEWSNGAITEDIGALTAGTYTVTITDANGCTAVLNATITQPSAPLIPVLTITNNVSCFGGSDGSISLAVSGGTQPYIYLWNTGATGTSISGLPAGQYTLTVTDANGCNAIISDFISEPAASLNAPLTVTQQVSCYGGSNGVINTSASGGTAPYVYIWNTGATTSSVSGLSTGTYTVTVTDAHGCTYSGSANVSQPSAPLALSGNTTIADCLYGIGGSVTTSVNGGTPPYAYLWNNGATTQTINNAPPGSYSVTVTDANGCTLNQQFTIGNQSEINLQNGPATICVGDVTTLSVDSIGGAQYQWYYNSTELLGANSHTFTTPAAGYYYVSVTTSCGTFVTDSVEVIVKSIENATITSNQIICPPETVQLHATGGVTYQWTPATFISNPQSASPVVSPVVTTTYTVEVTNEWGCKALMNVDVAVACDTLFVPNGFSPNGDGVNDGYVIDGIENYPGNKLWVYNRWGNLVYKKKDYDNSWDGVANVSGIYMGKKVPTGTYFFILDLNDNSKPRAGYLIIRR